jgi:hypothetical protein
VVVGRLKIPFLDKRLLGLVTGVGTLIGIVGSKPPENPALDVVVPRILAVEAWPSIIA